MKWLVENSAGEIREVEIMGDIRWYGIELGLGATEEHVAFEIDSEEAKFGDDEGEEGDVVDGDPPLLREWTFDEFMDLFEK